MFDIKEFTSTSVQQTLDDKFNLVPEGEYQAQIPADPTKAFESKSDVKDGKPWAQMVIKMEIIDPTGNIEKELGRKPSITDRFFLDLDSNGALDFGKQKNVRIGQYLTALDLNKPGWNFGQWCGKPLKVKVVHVKSDLDPTRKVAKVTTLGRG